MAFLFLIYLQINLYIYMKDLKDMLNEGILDTKQVNTQDLVNQLVESLERSFEDYGKTDQVDSEDFFNRMADIMEKENVWDNIYLLYRVWNSAVR